MILKIVAIVVGFLVMLIGIVWSMGALLPETHRVSGTVHLNQPPEKVWAVLTDFAAIPKWWPDQVSARREERPGGKEVWLAGDRHGQEIPFETAEAVPPKRLVRRILDEGLPFGGTWTFELQPSAGGTELTLTEDGFIRVSFFRFVARYIVGYRGTLDSFLGSLKKHLDGQ